MFGFILLFLCILSKSFKLYRLTNIFDVALECVPILDLSNNNNLECARGLNRICHHIIISKTRFLLKALETV